MFNTKIEINADKELQTAIKNALDPEKDFKTSRADYNLTFKNDKLIISVSAKDSTAFRAVMNSITSLVTVVEKTWRIKNGK